MKVHSNRKISKFEFEAACPQGVFISSFETAGSRLSDYAWEIRLSGSNPSMQQGGTGFHAATWDEWGLWIAEVFKLDPLAVIGPYKGQGEFHRITKDKFRG